MKVELQKTYPMPAAADVVWALMQDIEGVAGCMPGAKVTERIDATHYKGTVAVKLGPASLSFRGEIEVKGIDASARSLHLYAKGTDTTGGSAASMDLTARVEPLDAASCNVVGTSELTMSGKAAAFGGRMMGPVADQVLNQFAANFATRVQATKAATPGPNAEVGAERPSADKPVRSTAAANAPPTQPLDGLALMWAMLKGWLRSLFAARHP